MGDFCRISTCFAMKGMGLVKAHGKKQWGICSLRHTRLLPRQCTGCWEKRQNSKPTHPPKAPAPSAGRTKRKRAAGPASASTPAARGVAAAGRSKAAAGNGAHSDLADEDDAQVEGQEGEPPPKKRKIHKAPKSKAAGDKDGSKAKPAPKAVPPSKPEKAEKAAKAGDGAAIKTASRDKVRALRPAKPRA